MKKILIVDDDPSLARTFDLYFRSRHYDVCTSETGCGAIELWRAEDPACVYMLWLSILPIFSILWLSQK